MRILFAIAVFSFAALVWAALAMLRHVRKNSRQAAAKPAADAAMSEAIDLRLNQIVRQPVRQGLHAASTDSSQDFSYFNRDVAPSPSDKKAFTDPPAPIKPAVADRT